MIKLLMDESHIRRLREYAIEEFKGSFKFLAGLIIYFLIIYLYIILEDSHVIATIIKESFYLVV